MDITRNSDNCLAKQKAILKWEFEAGSELIWIPNFIYHEKTIKHLQVLTKLAQYVSINYYCNFSKYCIIFDFFELYNLKYNFFFQNVTRTETKN